MKQRKKIKVLQFTIAATKGGRTLYVLNHWNHIDKSRFQYDFITFSPHLDFEQQLLDEGCAVHHISCYPEQDRERFIKELDAILEHGYDVIHIHTSYWKDTIVEERAKAKGVKKIIIHAHNTGGGISQTREQEKEIEQQHFKVRDKITADLATDYWACSKEAAQWLYGDKLDKSKIKIMKNAIEVQRFSYDAQKRRDVRKELGLEGKFVLGNVGRFAYQKNHAFLLRLFLVIREKCPDAMLLLLGDGPLRHGIQRQAEEYGIIKNVCFVDFTNEVSKYYLAMDVFLLPSFFEGLPFVLLEAQVAGLKCICSEFVSQEAIVTENVQRMSVDHLEDWIKQIMEWSAGYERSDQSEVVRQAGFNIYKQIKVIETEYLR